MRRVLPLIAAVALCATRAVFAADAAPIAPLHLSYATKGAEGCPNEAAFRRDVALRLGVDPFVSSALAADRTLAVVVDGRTTPWSVIVTITDAKGKTLGRRVITEPRSSCSELVANAAFAASVAIDPNALARVEEPPAPEPHPSPPPPSAAPAPAATAPSPMNESAPRDSGTPGSSEIGGRVHAGAVATFGLLPSSAFGLAAGVSAGTRVFDVGAELVFVSPADASVVAPSVAPRQVTLSTSLVGGDVHACVHLRSVVAPYACGVFFGGVLRSSASGIDRPRESAGAWLALAPRLGVELPVSKKVAIDVRVDVPFPLTPADLRVDDRTVWSSGAVAVMAGAGASLAVW